MSAAQLERPGAAGDGMSERSVPQGHWDQALRLAFRAVFGLVGILGLLWLGSGIRQVPPDARAVVFRFGGLSRVADPGVLLVWPRPIEQVVLVPAAARQVELDLASGGMQDVGPSVRDNAGFLLTGDLGVVRLQARLFYVVVDPPSYLLAGERLDPALRRLFAASAAAACASRRLDEVLSIRPGVDAATGDAGQAPAPPGDAVAPGREMPPGGDEEGDLADGSDESPPPAMPAATTQPVSPARLRDDILAAVNARLAGLERAGAGLGVAAARVDITVELPGVAKAAFSAVLAATQSADRAIAEARTYAATARQNAEQNHDRAVAAAQAAANERISSARQTSTPIIALSSAAEPRAVLMQRLYADRIGPILGRAASVTAVAAEPAGHLILPGVTP